MQQATRHVEEVIVFGVVQENKENSTNEGMPECGKLGRNSTQGVREALGMRSTLGVAAGMSRQRGMHLVSCLLPDCFLIHDTKALGFGFWDFSGLALIQDWLKGLRDSIDGKTQNPKL